jgi:hypothetical protein
VCRCPECRRFFCRECVVSFDGRLLCAACIARASEPPLAPRKSSHAGQILLGMVALFLIWTIFYCLGWIILQYRETLPVSVASKLPGRDGSSPPQSHRFATGYFQSNRAVGACVKAPAQNRAREQADSFGAVTVALRHGARKRTQGPIFPQNAQNFTWFPSSFEQALTVPRALTGVFTQTREQVDGDGAVTVRGRTPHCCDSPLPNGSVTLVPPQSGSMPFPEASFASSASGIPC